VRVAGKAGIEGEKEPDPLSAPARVIAVARAMAADRLVVGTVGNVSARRGDRILITPSRRRYEELGHGDIAEVDLTGKQMKGPHPASRELPLHLAVYAERSDISAIVHTHSPHATAWSFLSEPLLPTTEDNVYYGIGPVRTSAPAVAGSSELAAAAVESLGDSAAVLLGNHGVLTVGTSPEGALDVARTIEHQAQVAWLLRSFRGRVVTTSQ